MAFVLDEPRKEKALLDGVYAQAAHHAPEAMAIIGPVYAAMKRHAEMHGFPVVPKSVEAPGRQVRFTHRGRYFKLKWSHEQHGIVLAEVLGNAEGPVIETFTRADTPVAVDQKFGRAMRGLRRARR